MATAAGFALPQALVESRAATADKCMPKQTLCGIKCYRLIRAHGDFLFCNGNGEKPANWMVALVTLAISPANFGQWALSTIP